MSEWAAAAMEMPQPPNEGAAVHKNNPRRHGGGYFFRARLSCPYVRLFSFEVMAMEEKFSGKDFAYFLQKLTTS